MKPSECSEYGFSWLFYIAEIISTSAPLSQPLSPWSYKFKLFRFLWWRCSIRWFAKLSDLCKKKREDGAMEAKWEEDWLYIPQTLWSMLIFFSEDRFEAIIRNYTTLQTFSWCMASDSLQNLTNFHQLLNHNRKSNKADLIKI